MAPASKYRPKTLSAISAPVRGVIGCLANVAGIQRPLYLWLFFIGIVHIPGVRHGHHVSTQGSSSEKLPPVSSRLALGFRHIQPPLVQPAPLQGRAAWSVHRKRLHRRAARVPNVPAFSCKRQRAAEGRWWPRQLQSLSGGATAIVPFSARATFPGPEPRALRSRRPRSSADP